MCNATVCPKGSVPAGTLYVSDISAMTVQEQIYFSSLQGITAQRKPRIYLLRDKKADEFWLDYMLKKGYVKSVKKVDPWKLHEQFKSEIKGAVIFDPKLSASVNVATMIAGVHKAAICTEEIAKRTGLPVKFDLRGKWAKNTDAYTWAMDNLYPKMNRTILCSLYPYAAGGWLRDYLIQHKIFTFWISQPGDKDIIGASADEKDMMGKVLDKWPANIPVIGFWYAGEDQKGINEYNGLVFAGKTGKFTIVYDWASNTSVHSGIRVPDGAFKQKHAPKLKLDNSKIYVMMTQFESGDAPWYWPRIQYSDWQDKARGTFPMGWCLGPTTVDLLPAVLQWHYENATPNDYFFCSMSGVGYMMPHAFATGVDDPDKVWGDFMKLTADYMKRLDLDMVSLHTDAWHAQPQYEDSKMLKRYTEGIPGLKAILSDFGRLEALDPDRANHFVDGVPVFHTLNRWLIEGDPAEYLAKQMRDVTPKTRPAFLSLMALSWTYKPAIIKAAMDKMGDEYVFVTPEQMVDLYKECISEKQ
ncbi:MAG: GxGYxYP domain-containing protein [Armatimonadota bacterium]